MSLFPLSLQLYSLRAQAERDFVAVLKKVAAIGYKRVQPGGIWNLRPKELRHILDDLGLTMVSSHTPWANSASSLGEVMEIADALGLDSVVCGYSAKEFSSLDNIKATAENTNRMREILLRNGFVLFQHNHEFEFERLDGRLKYEIYRDLCLGIKFEIDCFWSTNLGKEDPVEMLKTFADDTILIHLKDGYCRQEVTGNAYVNGFLERHVDLQPLGRGELPIPALIGATPEQVREIVVELDYCDIDMFEAVKESFDYMISNKLASAK